MADFELLAKRYAEPVLTETKETPMLNYAYRALLAVYMLLWMGWAATYVGSPPSGQSLTWSGFATFVLALVVSAFLGWQAKGEAADVAQSKHDNPF